MKNTTVCTICLYLNACVKRRLVAGSLDGTHYVIVDIEQLLFPKMGENENSRCVPISFMLN